MSVCRLVTFDATNTLIRVLGNVGKHYADAATAYGLHAKAYELDQAFKVQWKEMNKKYPNFGSTQGFSSHKWWTNLVRNCFNFIGYDPNSNIIADIADHLYLHFSTDQGWEVIPGSKKVLENLKKMGLLIGVISNYDERLEKVLLSLALRHYFDFIIVSAVEKVAKPNEEIFQRALCKAGVKPAEAIHVGNDILNDYLGARQAGLIPLLLSSEQKALHKEVDSKFVIRDIKEIFSYIK